MMMDEEAILAAYAKDGYAVIPEMLSAEELMALNTFIDRDRQENSEDWHAPRQGAAGNGQVLLRHPEWDRFVRHPRMMSLFTRILGSDVRFAQYDFREVAPDASDHSGMQWHRDVSFYGKVGGALWDPENPYHSTYACAIYYLSDVHDCCPCFAMVPASHEFRTLEEAKRTLGPHYRETPLRGPAGTAILYNITTWHTRVSGATTCPHGRRTMHVYQSRKGNAPLTEWARIPEALALSGDAETRAYYSQWTPGQIAFARETYESPIPTWYP